MKFIDPLITLVPLVGKTAKLQRFYLIEQLRNHQFDLSIEQWFLLCRLYNNDGQNQNDLAFITDRNKASLARLINNLEDKGLVARIPSSEDKRVKNIYLTKNGKIYFEKTISIVSDAFKAFEKGINKTEKEIAMKVLFKIQNNISNLSK